MINGTFKVWEFAVLISAWLIILGGFVLNIAVGIGSPEFFIFAGFLTMTATLFVRPIWLLVNRGRIENWEHVTARVADKKFLPVKFRRSTVYKVILTLRFKDGMGKEYNESFTAPAFMRRADNGVEYEIAFDPKHPDRLIALNPAHEQAVLMTVLGIILEISFIALSIFAYVMDKSGGK